MNHTSMPRTNLYFRADGSHAIGLGHVYRSLALCAMLRNDFTCCFLIRAPSDSLMDLIRSECDRVEVLPDFARRDDETDAVGLLCEPGSIVVLDGYGFDTNYQRKLRRFGLKLVAIDDLCAYPFVTEIVINPAEGVQMSDYSLEQPGRILLGARFALLRMPFLEAARNRTISTVRMDAFVCFGGADSFGLTSHAVRALLDHGGFQKIQVVLGPDFRMSKEDRILFDREEIMVHRLLSAEDLVRIMRQCRVAIIPASGIAYEVCAVGVPAICGFYVENQRRIHAGLVERGCILDAGDFTAWRHDVLGVLIEQALEDDFQEMSLVAQSLFIDGRSPERLRAEFLQLC